MRFLILVLIFLGNHLLTCLEFLPWSSQPVYPLSLQNSELLKSILREVLPQHTSEEDLDKYQALWAVYPPYLITQSYPDIFSEELALKINTLIRESLNIHDGILEDKDPEKCYALVLSGGSNRGAWEAAVVKGLITRYKTSGKTIDWDVVSGVSVGAIGAYISLFFESADEWSEKLWGYWWYAPQYTLSDCQLPISKNIGKWFKMILKKFIDPDAVFHYLCSIIGSKRRLENYVPPKLKVTNKSIVITAARLEDGLSRSWFGWNSTGEELLDAVFASLAYPLVYQPVYINGSYFMDGGIRANANLKDAIIHCMEFRNVTSDKVIVDYIETQPLRPRWFPFPYNNMDIRGLINRAFDILHYNIRGFSKLQEAIEMFPNTTFRHFINPMGWHEFQHWPTIALDVSDRSKMQNMMKIGISTGMKAGILNKTQILNYNRTNTRYYPLLKLPNLG
ncbi:patatin-like phospholipase family protein [Cryptosporidium andersoni]|uniref:Patatin-like phospholipase family protein n=1 Tax=Cryptosporidium andersoni TaxID=117008 RepID=A0A1J4MQ57_9CRYT|nr:patatin-like phospholipase family protein [Cryptosporidium andersoni]